MLVNSGLGVFVNSETVQFHFNQFNDSISFNFYTDIDEFEKNSNQLRIAAFHVPFPPDTKWLENLQRAGQVSSRIFVFCSELHQATVEQIKLLDQPNISLYISGIVTHQFCHARVYEWLDWFHTSSEFYVRANSGFLDDKLMPYQTKNKMFDILLGCQRPHRDFVYQHIKNNSLEDKTVMTYVYYAHRSIINNDQFILETENIKLDPATTYTHSVNRVMYYDFPMQLSQIVPIEIYNQTAYSLVTETNACNDFNFYTEKIVKPLLARRLFVVIAGQYYLKNLRAMGFKTFNSIIDESYDDVADNQQRWKMAMQQVEILCRQDQRAVLDSIKDITEHNYQLISNKNWYKEMLLNLVNEIKQ